MCIPAALLCDGWENCPESADESEEICSMRDRRTQPVSDKKTIFVGIFVVVIIVCLVAYTNLRRTQMCRTTLAGAVNEPKDDQAMDPLSPATHKPTQVSKIAAVSENVRMSTLNSRTTVANSYDRNNITGASSSTTNGSIGYINPPPSPETTRTNRHRYTSPYHNYKRQKPPPPSPAETTDFCDESDEYRTHSRIRSPLSCEPHDYRTSVLRTASNGTGSINSNSLRKARQYCYNEPCPPPPTPRSHYHSDGHQAPESSCPGTPSPIRSISISSSTYIPPPPSPQLKN